MLNKICTLSRRICEPAPLRILGPTKQIKTQCATLLWVNTAVLWVVYWGVEAAVLCFSAPVPREQCEDVIIFDNLKVSCQALAAQGCITERKTSNKKQRSLLNSATVLYCSASISLLHESSESHCVISSIVYFPVCRINHKELTFDKTSSRQAPFSSCDEAFSRITWPSHRVCRLEKCDFLFLKFLFSELKNWHFRYAITNFLSCQQVTIYDS